MTYISLKWNVFIKNFVFKEEGLVSVSFFSGQLDNLNLHVILRRHNFPMKDIVSAPITIHQ